MYIVHSVVYVLYFDQLIQPILEIFDQAELNVRAEFHFAPLDDNERD